MKTNEIDDSKNDELFYLRDRLTGLVQCVPVEKFTPRGEGNTNYNLFIHDIVQFDTVAVTEHIDPNKISVVMYSEDNPVPRILVFEKEPAV